MIWLNAEQVVESSFDRLVSHNTEENTLSCSSFDLSYVLKASSERCPVLS